MNEVEINSSNNIHQSIYKKEFDFFDENRFNTSEKKLFGIFCQTFIHKKEPYSSIKEENFISFYHAYDKNNIRPEAYLYMIGQIFQSYKTCQYNHLIQTILDEFSHENTYFNQNIKQIIPSLLSISVHLDIDTRSNNRLSIFNSILNTFSIEKLLDIKDDEKKEDNIKSSLYDLLYNIVTIGSREHSNHRVENLESLLSHRACKKLLDDREIVLDLAKLIVKRQDESSLKVLLHNNQFNIFDHVQHYYTEQLNKNDNAILDTNPDHIYALIKKYKLKYVLDHDLKNKHTDNHNTNIIKRNKI